MLVDSVRNRFLFRRLRFRLLSSLLVRLQDFIVFIDRFLDILVELLLVDEAHVHKVVVARVEVFKIIVELFWHAREVLAIREQLVPFQQFIP